MPNQIDKGYDFQTGQLVTADNLDNLVQQATLLKGAISEQPEQTETLEGSDQLLVNDVSDSLAIKPKKATLTQIMSANLPVTTGIVNGGGDLSVANTDGPLVTATGYTHVANNVVTVASPSHELLVGDFIEITCVSLSGDNGSKFGGLVEVLTVPNVNSFTYEVSGTVTASSGTCTWKKSGRTKFNANVQVLDDLIVDGNTTLKGNLKIESNGSVLMPKGNTAARPVNPEAGEFRYNSELNRAEIYNGTEWKELGASPFNASGGSFVLEPSTVETAANFTSTESGAVVTITISGGHDICMGQVVELKTAIVGYSGEYTVTSIADQFTLSFRTSKTGLAVVSNAACTVRKSGNHKVHVFKTTGNLVVGNEDGLVEVLIVGGGGGRTTTPRWNNKGGGSGGVLVKKNVKLAKNTTYNCVVGAGGASNDADGTGSPGGTSGIAVLGQSTTSYVYATGGGEGSGGESGWSGYTSDNAHLPDSQRRYLGTIFGDWGYWGEAGAGAGGGQSCVPRTGIDSQYTGDGSAGANRVLPAGVVSDITNIPVMYSPSGGDNRCQKPWAVTLDSGMYSSVESKGFRAIGIGATARGVSEPYKPNNGKSGIVIIRYPFKLQT